MKQTSCPTPTPEQVFNSSNVGSTIVTVEPWSAKLVLVGNPVALLPPPGRCGGSVKQDCFRC